MTEVRFYHLQTTAMEQSLPQLLTKILSIGHRVVVKLGSKDSVKYIDNLLWSFDANSFLPHSSDKKPDEQPIWITDKDENPNGANLLILADNAVVDDISSYEICCEIFDGHDINAVKRARQHWKQYQSEGFKTSYYQQNDNGAWEKKA